MNKGEGIPRKTISMDKETLDTLEQLSKKEHRSASQQIVHMLEFYIKNKQK